MLGLLLSRMVSGVPCTTVMPTETVDEEFRCKVCRLEISALSDSPPTSELTVLLTFTVTGPASGVVGGCRIKLPAELPVVTQFTLSEVQVPKISVA